ncbi:hypothetical protein BD560DRAFT_400834 [Blakeslea trispora]|nr:hypothetical protein BD560DRAFT_400834 [Blakeslea trispora]
MMNINFSAEREILNRIANVSQEIMYPSVPKRKEVPLRKLLLTSRLWEKAREEEERLTEIESRNGSVAGGNDDDWWLTSTDETLEALVSFVNESPSLLERDPESPSALLDLDYSQQMFLNNTPASDDLESETWSWLDVAQETAVEEMPKVNATQNLLSHTLHLEELAEDESEEDSEEDNLNVNSSYNIHTPQQTQEEEEEEDFHNEEWQTIHEKRENQEEKQEKKEEYHICYPSKGFPCRTMLLDHQTVQVGKKIIYINQDANAPMLPPPTLPIRTNTCKRKRDDVDDEGFAAAPPAKKPLLQNDQSSTAARSSHSSYPSDTLPLLRV